MNAKPAPDNPPPAPLADSPSDPPRRAIHLAAGPLAYTDEGEGPVILAVHGLPGSVRDFRWLAAFARVVQVDLPGFGETPVATGPDPSPLGRARVVVELVRELGLPRLVILGHSMGGLVACAAARLAPELFSGLGMLSSPGLRPHRMFRRLPFRFLGALVSRPALGALLRPAMRRFFSPAGFRGYPDAALVRTLQCVGRTSFEDHAETVRGLSLPMLVAWCEDDALIEAEISAELAEACPPGPRLRFGEGGHNPQKSHAGEIAEALGAWLEELDGEGPGVTRIE